MKRIRVFVEKQSFFILLAVCLLIIAVSGYAALVLREQGSEGVEAAGSPDSVQRLSDAERMKMVKPTAGQTLRGFSQTAWLDTLGYYGAHEAVDISAEKGAKVRAAKAGTVTAAYRDKQWGGVVEIDHENGVRTRYAALAWPLPVREGQAVAAGEEIGAVGLSAFEGADAPHLHFEAYQDGTAVNPAPYLVE